MIIELSTASAVTGIGGCTSVQKKGTNPDDSSLSNAIALEGIGDCIGRDWRMFRA